MRLASSTTRAGGGAERRPERGRSAARWAVPACYLLSALVLTARLWAHPASLTQPGDPHDVDLFAWFMRHDAAAIAHGTLPSLVTTALNAPQGVNLMWNTSLLLPGILLAPVTLLAGPQVSLTLMLTLGFAGSAGALFLVLRRWDASVAAAALAGALYGFSPVLLATATGHYHLQFAVLPPLMIDALLRVVTGRGRPARTGAWLGLLAAAQVFIGEELLADTAVAGLVMVAVLAALRPRQVAGRIRPTAIGLAGAAAVALALCGYPLWIQFHGPLTQHGSPWPLYANHPAGLVTAPAGLLLHPSAGGVAHPLPEHLAYLGWPLLVTLAAASIRYWRDTRVRFAAVTLALLEIFSFGGSGLAVGGVAIPAAALPWHWLQVLPPLNDMLPDRLVIVADGVAAVLLAFSLDLLRFSLDLLRAASPRARRWRRALPATIASLAILPLTPLPLQAISVPATPPGWQASFTRLKLAPGARVLVVPVPYGHNPDAMRWQATTGEPGSLIGGRCIAPGASGQAAPCPTGLTPTARYLDALSRGATAPAPAPGQVRADLAAWRPAAVVAVARRGSALEKFLVGVFGPPSLQIRQVISWRL